jgi:hypothetical protein
VLSAAGTVFLDPESSAKRAGFAIGCAIGPSNQWHGPTSPGEGASQPSASRTAVRRGCTIKCLELASQRPPGGQMRPCREHKKLNQMTDEPRRNSIGLPHLMHCLHSLCLAFICSIAKRNSSAERGAAASGLKSAVSFCAVIGFAISIGRTGDSASRICAKRIKALSIQRNKTPDMANETLPANTQTSSYESATSTPRAASAILTQPNTRTANILISDSCSYLVALVSYLFGRLKKRKKPRIAPGPFLCRNPLNARGPCPSPHALAAARTCVRAGVRAGSIPAYRRIRSSSCSG